LLTRKNVRDDGLYDKVPRPDIVIGAHVMPERAGVIGTKHGLIASSADRFQYVMHHPRENPHAKNLAPDSASWDVKPTLQPPTVASTP
jgi:metal-dependent amidase/aminoacylase/carboxypeptidase family protein